MYLLLLCHFVYAPFFGRSLAIVRISQPQYSNMEIMAVFMIYLDSKIDSRASGCPLHEGIHQGLGVGT